MSPHLIPRVLRPIDRGVRSVAGLLVALLLPGFPRWTVRGEVGVAYKFENYAEHGGRTEVDTHAAMVEAELPHDLKVRAQFVYDGISGATPIGAPPPSGSDQVPVVPLTDIRRAETLEVEWKPGRYTLAPLFTHSEENDYVSYGMGLNGSVDWNQKNSTLNLGVVRNFDSVQPVFFRNARRRDEWDVLMGLVQVLNKYALLTVNLTLGTASGYLSDPYKGVRFDGYPDPRKLYADQRPGHRTRQVVWVGWNQAVPPLDAAVETSYRFSHDSFGVLGHTVSVEWFQNLGSKWMVAPLFRYHRQSAASFYGVRFPGDPGDPDLFPDVVIPPFYTADYRLSELQTITYGLSISWRVHPRATLEGAYKHYQMRGLDGITSASNYPEADIWTLGVRLRF